VCPVYGMRPIFYYHQAAPLLNSFEHTAVHALQIVRGFQKKRRDRGDENRATHAFGSVFSDGTRDLAASHREPHESEILEIQMCDDLLQVFCESIVLGIALKFRVTHCTELLEDVR
jgi:hypothetical protein